MRIKVYTEFPSNCPNIKNAEMKYRYNGYGWEKDHSVSYPRWEEREVNEKELITLIKLGERIKINW